MRQIFQMLIKKMPWLGAQSRRPRPMRSTMARPGMESYEPRVLLSATDVTFTSQAASAEILAARVRSTLSVISGIGLVGGRGTLTASLTSGGAPLAGKMIRFRIGQRFVGSAVTNENGIATLANVNLRGLRARTYPRGVAARFLGDGQFRGVAQSGSLSVSRFAVALSEVSGAGDYGSTSTLSAKFTLGGAPLAGQQVQFKLGDTIVGTATTNTSGFATLGGISLAGYNAGSYAGAVTASSAGASAGGSLVVNKAQAQLTIAGLDQVYNGAPRLATVTTTPEGLAISVTYKDSGGDTVPNPTSAGNYSVIATITNPNYTGVITGTLVVAQAPLTVAGITASNKVYDGDTQAALDTASAQVQGVVAGDNVTLDASGAAGAFADKNVGSDKAVAITGLVLQGSDAGNYVLVPPSTAADITPAVATVTGINASHKTYDGSIVATLNTAGAALAGIVVGDIVTLDTSGATGTFNSPDVGTNKVVTIAGLTLGGADAGNYSLIQPTTTANITQATLTVTGIIAGNKVYDGGTGAALDTVGATLDGVVAGDDVTLDTSGAVGVFADRNVGTNKQVSISGITLTGADVSKYTLTQPTATASIGVRTLAVEGITAFDKDYNGNSNAAIDVTEASLSGVVQGDTVSLDSSGAFGQFVDKNVGMDKVVTIGGLTLVGTDAENYTFVAPTTHADIFAVTVHVDGLVALSKAYDGNADAVIDTNGAVLNVIIEGDLVTLDTNHIVGTFNSPDIGFDKTVMITGLALAGSDAGNYLLAPPDPTTADITQAALRVLGITAANKIYDGSIAADIDTAGATLEGVVEGDDVSLVTDDTFGTFEDKNAGSDKAVTIGGLFLVGADAYKYALVDTTARASISQATVEIAGITAIGKFYNANTDAAIDVGGAMIVGLIDGDDVTLDTSGAFGTFEDKNAGIDKVVTIGGLVLAGIDADNYTFIAPTTLADIEAATLTVGGVTVDTKVYDGNTDAALDTSAAVLVGVIEGDDVTLDPSSASAAFIDKNVGTAKPVASSGFALTGADAGNYVVIQPDLTGEITAAHLSVEGIAALNRVYNGTTNASLDTSNAQLFGVVEGDDVALEPGDAAGSFATKNVGSDKLVTIAGLALSGADAGNYVLDDATSQADVSAAELTVVGISAEDKFYDGNTDAALILTFAELEGVVLGDDVTLDSSDAVGTFQDADPGIDKVVVISGLTILGPDSENYILIQPETTASIFA